MEVKKHNVLAYVGFESSTLSAVESGLVIV